MKPALLIAEGDAELCGVYRRFLTQRGYEVETALDGLDCLAKLRRQLPAALVLDRELHWGGGDGVLAWLREQSDGAKLPVVLTATADNSSVDMQPPIVKFLPKPFTLASLLESVRHAIANKRRAEPFYLNGAAPNSELFIG